MGFHCSGEWYKSENQLTDRRGRSEVLWGLTACYATALVAYAQLMRSLRRDKNDAFIVYRLLIFVIFPLYPCMSLASNLATAVWRKYWRTHHKQHLHVHFWSNLIGLHVIAADGSSESFSGYDGWRAEVHAMNNLRSRLGHALVLALTTVQTIGMFVRVLCRLIMLRDEHDRFEGIAVADFEAFHLSVGMMAILFMSWSALALNVTWQEDPETLPGPKRLHSERFWTSNDRAFARTLRWILVKGSMLGILGLTLFYAFAIFQHNREVLADRFYDGASVFILWSQNTPEWTSKLIYLIGCYCKISLNVTVPLMLWLQKRDSEATPGGLTFALHGFVASILFTAYRFYYQVNVDTFIDEPVSPAILFSLTIIRFLLLRCSRKGAWTKAARVSRTALLVLWVLLIIVAPAFVLSALQLSPDSCAMQAKKDPIWTPSF